MEDLIIDIPNLVILVSTFIANAILDEYFIMSHLEQLLNPYISSNDQFQAASLATEIFIAIAEQTSFPKLRELYRKSKLDLSKLLPLEQPNSEDLIAFLSEKDLSDLLPQLTYGSHLEKMLHERSSGEDIINWIQENVPQDVQEDVSFCRHFVSCILKQIGTSETLEQQTFQEFAPTLKHFLVTENLQRNCLFEVQLFCYHANFPTGLMERLFEYLYSFEIATAEVFIMWAEDEGVIEGKKESLNQTNKWLNKLKQQIEDEED